MSPPERVHLATIGPDPLRWRQPFDIPRFQQSSGRDLTADLGHAESRPGLEEARRSDGGEEDVLGGVPPGRGGAVPDDAGGDGGGHRRGPGDHGWDVVGVAEGGRGGGAPAAWWPVWPATGW